MTDENFMTDEKFSSFLLKEEFKKKLKKKKQEKKEIKEKFDKFKNTTKLCLFYGLGYFITALIVSNTILSTIRTNYTFYCNSDGCYIITGKNINESDNNITNTILLDECKVMNLFYLETSPLPYPRWNTDVCLNSLSLYKKIKSNDINPNLEHSHETENLSRNEKKKEKENEEEIKEKKENGNCHSNHDCYKNEHCDLYTGKCMPSIEEKTIDYCLINSDCHILEKCTLDHKCVRDDKKKAPKRLCDDFGCDVELNDGECYSEQDCKDVAECNHGFCSLYSGWECTEYYECQYYRGLLN